MAKFKTFLLDHTSTKPLQSPVSQPRTWAEWDETTFWLGLPLFAASILAFAVPFYFLWGRNIFHSPQWISLWPLVCLPISIVIHEGLHGLGFLVFGKAPWRSISFGIKPWPHMEPYAKCTAPMPGRAFRLAIALPMLVLGIVPGIIGLIMGSVGWTLWGALNTAASGGDMLILLFAPSVVSLGERKWRRHAQQWEEVGRQTQAVQRAKIPLRLTLVKNATYTATLRVAARSFSLRPSARAH